MRPALLASFCVLLAACESDLTISASTVEWMEWPAEVHVATPFMVRMLVSRPGCSQGIYKPGASADQSAVSFAPYFLVKDNPQICPLDAQQLDIYYVDLDTAGTAPGLAANYVRTYEMRAASSVYGPERLTAADLDVPLRTYGEVTVRLNDPDSPESTTRNAGGFANKFVDNGCVRLQPVGGLGWSYVLEDQADTTGLAYAFVRGYVHDVVTPVCGQTRVFELLSRN